MAVHPLCLLQVQANLFCISQPIQLFNMDYCFSAELPGNVYYRAFAVFFFANSSFCAPAYSAIC